MAGSSAVGKPTRRRRAVGIGDPAPGLGRPMGGDAGGAGPARWSINRPFIAGRHAPSTRDLVVGGGVRRRHPAGGGSAGGGRPAAGRPGVVVHRVVDGLDHLPRRGVAGRLGGGAGQHRLYPPRNRLHRVRCRSGGGHRRRSGPGAMGERGFRPAAGGGRTRSRSSRQPDGSAGCRPAGGPGPDLLHFRDHRCPQGSGVVPPQPIGRHSGRERGLAVGAIRSAHPLSAGVPRAWALRGHLRDVVVRGVGAASSRLRARGDRRRRLDRQCLALLRGADHVPPAGSIGSSLGAQSSATLCIRFGPAAGRPPPPAQSHHRDVGARTVRDDRNADERLEPLRR